MRTREHPHEWRQAPARWQAYVKKHNDLTDISVRIARAAYRAGGTFVIENPIDRGDRESKWFNKRFADHVPLWVMPGVCELADEVKPVWVSVPMCAFKGEFQKYTTLMAAGPTAAYLRVLNYLTCSHTSHTATAEVAERIGDRIGEDGG